MANIRVCFRLDGDPREDSGARDVYALFTQHGTTLTET